MEESIRRPFLILFRRGENIPITTILYRVQLTLLRNCCLFFTQPAPNLPGKMRGPVAFPAHPRNPPMSMCWGGRGRKDHALQCGRGLWVWLCNLFLAMLLIHSGTLGDSFNLSLSQIQTSTSSYYNIWLHYGIVERLN